MFLQYFFIVLLFNFISGDWFNSFVEIKTKYGIVRGQKKVTLFEEKEFNSFRGIPYAKPPLNHLRFLPPEPPHSWAGVLDTVNYKSECMQITFGATDITGDEDCLYLNVFSPATESDERLPVMLFAHGGGFYFGNGGSMLCGPEFIVEKNVILVTFNFRVSIFGFLSLNDEVYSGNMGLKDYLMALTWVNENIEFFNGDPTRVTIFGHSSGAIMTHLLAISPASKGLFQRAITLSGTALYQYSVNDKHHRDAMFDLAKKEQNIYDFDGLVKFLQTYDSRKLFNATYFKKTVYPGRRQPQLYWAPVIESPMAIMPVITDSPENMFEAQGEYSYDFMFEITTHEALYLVDINEAKDSEYLKPFDEKFEILLPHSHFKLDFNSDEYKEMAKAIREYYFGQDIVNNETFYQFLHLYSDALFGYGIDYSVRKNVARSSGATYYFRFSIDAELNWLKQWAGLGELIGTSHGDELCYVFKCDYYSDAVYKSYNENTIERQTIDRITMLLTNFAKFGNPTPNNTPIHWEPVTTRKHNFLDIRHEGLILAQNPNHKYFSFWDDLFDKYKHYAKPIGRTSTKISKGSTAIKNDEL